MSYLISPHARKMFLGSLCCLLPWIYGCGEGEPLTEVANQELTTSATVTSSDFVAGLLGEVRWTFNQPSFDGVSFKVKVTTDPGLTHGYYFQIYNSIIGDNSWDEGAYYFGLQTALNKPSVGNVGKGILFSRWGSNITESDLIPNTLRGGFTEISDHEGSFGGVRLPYNWRANITYEIKLIRLPGQTSSGVWYQLTIKPGLLPAINCGSIRFRNNPNGSIPMMKDSGPTWFEHYQTLVANQSQLPVFRAGILRASAIIGGTLFPAFYGTTGYAGVTVTNTDFAFDPGTKTFLVIIGGGTVRTHGAATYRTYW